MGVYYRNSFGTYETTLKWGPRSAIIDNIHIGKANIALFNYILSNVFEKVTPVQYLSHGTNQKRDIDLIIEPTILSYTQPEPTGPGGRKIHIIYEVNFYLPEGEKIGSWWIKGTGHIPLSLDENNALTELTQMAMREVAVKFITGFCKQGKIIKLINKECNP